MFLCTNTDTPIQLCESIDTDTTVIFGVQYTKSMCTKVLRTKVSANCNPIRLGDKRLYLSDTVVR